jgi:hypothetical protein
MLREATLYKGAFRRLPPDADAIEKRRWGYAFEVLLGRLFAIDEFEPWSDY